MQRCTARIIVQGLALLAPVAGAQAATFCVATASAFQTALDTAATNNQDDLIDVVAGHYALAAGLVFNSVEAKSLTISGGFHSSCLGQGTNATTLDGQGAVRPLYIYSNGGQVAVERITVQGGLSVSNRGGGMNISGAGGVRLDLNQFIGNHANDFAGALFASVGGGNLIVRNNLFLANSGAKIGAAELGVSSGNAYIVNNTVIGNTSTDGVNAGGFESGGSGTFHFYFANNIVWSNNVNGAPDLSLTGYSSRHNNDIGTVAGTASAVVSDEQSVDPQFAPCSGFLCFNFELARTSPLVDAGLDAPDSGTTVIDLAGKQRTIGAHVDIGAYENDGIFADGFE